MTNHERLPVWLVGDDISVTELAKRMELGKTGAQNWVDEFEESTKLRVPRGAKNAQQISGALAKAFVIAKQRHFKGSIRDAILAALAESPEISFQLPRSQPVLMPKPQSASEIAGEQLGELLSQIARTNADLLAEMNALRAQLTRVNVDLKGSLGERHEWQQQLDADVAGLGGNVAAVAHAAKLLVGAADQQQRVIAELQREVEDRGATQANVRETYEEAVVLIRKLGEHYDAERAESQQMRLRLRSVESTFERWLSVTDALSPEHWGWRQCWRLKRLVRQFAPGALLVLLIQLSLGPLSNGATAGPLPRVRTVPHSAWYCNFSLARQWSGCR